MSYTGTVKSFNPHKGWGFVECPALGADAFILKSELNGFAVNKGDQISFTVTQGEKGAQATGIKVLTAGTDGTQSFFGEVKSWNDAKGFGFLNSPASEQVFGKDVFALRGEFRDGVAFQGASVIFKAKMGERGPVASDVQVLGMNSMGGWGGNWGAAAWGTGGKGGWGGSFGGFGGFGGAWKAPSETEPFYGTIKSINTENGWGHIECEALYKMYNKDTFVMKTSLEGVAVHPGSAVVFNVSQGAKGPHAINIKPFDNNTVGMIFTGQIKSFNDTKGFGFIESAQAGEFFNKDIFVHQSDLGGKAVKTGDQVQFTIDTSSGRASAKNVNA